MIASTVPHHKAERPVALDSSRPDLLPAVFRASWHRFPPGVDRLIYQCEEARRRLGQTALLPHFSMPTPEHPNQPLFDGHELVGVRLHENLHRLQLRRRVRRGGVSPALARIAERRVAAVRVHWAPIPEDSSPSLQQVPPPVPFDTQRGQRFMLQDGHFSYAEPAGTGFYGFGCGRIFPTVYGDQPQLRLGAVVQVQQGLGQLAGLQGVAMLNGTVEPPEFMDLAITALLLDYNGKIHAEREPLGFEPLPNPDPGSTFLLFQATAEGPDLPVLAAKDAMFSLPVRLPIRLVSAEFGFSDERLVFYRNVGRRVGRIDDHNWLGPFSGTYPVPYQTRGGRLVFLHRDGRPLGAVRADANEGRAFLFDLPDLPMPGLLSAGIGPIDRGEGLFAGANGMVSKIGLTSLFPRATSIYYLLRLDDPDGNYRRAAEKAWG